MKTGALIALVGAAVVVGGAAWFVESSNRAAVTPSTKDLPAVLLEGLAARVNDVATISIKRTGAEFTIARRASEGGAGGGGEWVLIEKGGYPAKVEQVRELVNGLADLRPLERKTSKPELYPKIGVQDPDAKTPDGAPAGTTGGSLVTLKDAAGKTIAAVIVGNQKNDGTPAVFVRKAGEAQSWLAQGRIEMQSDALNWLDRQVLNVARERVKTATITPPDGAAVTVGRDKPEDPLFAVRDVPAGRELSTASAGEPIGYELTGLTFEDVAPADQVGLGPSGSTPPPADATPPAAPAAPTPGGHAQYRTFDGLIVDVRTVVKDGRTWAAFAAAFDEASAAAAPSEPGKGALRSADDVKKEAAEIQSKVGKWAFQLSEYKAKPLATKMDDLLKPPAPPPASTPAAANPELPGVQPPPMPGAPAPAPTAPPASVPPPAPPPPPPRRSGVST